ncbi:MAG TPA: 30S ribosomal protein S8 [Thermopetrobacter sp.]|nr:30S ribosomal protein S8 [Thermopetrobacter sp.]
MTMTDPIGDMLTRIRNAHARGKSKVRMPASRMRERVLQVLADEGFIRGFTTTEYDGGKAEIEVELKYYDGAPVIREITRVSKPGRRVYTSVADMPVVYNGLGIAILSTSKGVMSDAKAREANVGGEVICRVF